MNIGSNARVVNDLMISSLPKWDHQKLRENVPPQVAIDVIKTPIGWANNEDVMFWPNLIDGVYNVKSGYDVLSKKDPKLPIKY